MQAFLALRHAFRQAFRQAQGMLEVSSGPFLRARSCSVGDLEPFDKTQGLEVLERQAKGAPTFMGAPKRVEMAPRAGLEPAT